MFLERRDAPRGCVPSAAAAVGAGGRRARGGAQQWRHAAPTAAPLHSLFQALPSPTVSCRNQRSARFVHIRGDHSYLHRAQGAPQEDPKAGRRPQGGAQLHAQHNTGSLVLTRRLRAGGSAFVLETQQ